jgi:predicted anti-sigma-YlaC factor YlaD
MNCDEARRLLPDYLDRVLPPAARRPVDEHLIECPGCQRELALLTAVCSALDHQPVLDPPAGFDARVLANLPRRRRLGFDPTWLLLALPVAAIGYWLARGPMVRWLTLLGDRLGSVRLPATPSLTAGSVGPAQLVIGALVVAAIGLAAVTGFALVGWRLVRD